MAVTGLSVLWVLSGRVHDGASFAVSELVHATASRRCLRLNRECRRVLWPRSYDPDRDAAHDREVPFLLNV